MYPLLFEDWPTTIRRQQVALLRLLPAPERAGPILDCACGIGTQTLGLAQAGFAIEGSDIAAVAIDCARREALARGLAIDFRIDDLRELNTAPLGTFGVTLALDNALPHLESDVDISTALSVMRDRLRPGGILLVSVRDYGPLLLERLATLPPRFFGENGCRRIVHQVWDWIDERRYVVHQFITRQLSDERWDSDHFVGHYRAVTPEEIALLAERAGFQEVRVLPPSATGFYQPIIMGRQAGAFADAPITSAATVR